MIRFESCVSDAICYRNFWLFLGHDLPFFSYRYVFFFTSDIVLRFFFLFQQFPISPMFRVQPAVYKKCTLAFHVNAASQLI